MKKCILLLLLIFAIASSATAQVQPTDTDGDGYINISTLEQLRWVSENPSSWKNNYELDNNINAAATLAWKSGAGFSPIGNVNKKFSGKFNGNGFVIDSLYINMPKTSNIGLFGETSNCELFDIGITNCQITGDKFVGGLVGLLSASKVCRSYSSGNITAQYSVGGLLGKSYFSVVTNCYSTCNVFDGLYAGGFLGMNDSRSKVINCYSMGRVSSSKNKGGFVGYDSDRETFNCFWDTQTSGLTYSYSEIGKKTAEMKTKSTFTDAGWNFDFVWSIDTAVNNGYPYLNNRGLMFLGIEPKDTDGDGYRNIACYSHLHWVSGTPSSWAWNFELDNNINADTTSILVDGLGFSPIGNPTINFTGKFNGNGYAIDNIFIDRPYDSHIGLFGMTYESEISNIGITNCKVVGDKYIGGLVGLNDSSTVSNCYSNGYASGKNFVGGLVGENDYSTVIKSYSMGTVAGFGGAGGLVGSNDLWSTIDKSYSRVNVTCDYVAGGLVGSNNGYSALSNCYSTGSVTGNDGIGGLVGSHGYRSTISKCYSISNVSGKTNFDGLVGENNNFYPITDSFWKAQTSGPTHSYSGIGKTSSDMQTKSTYTSLGWDFDSVWAIAADYNDGYPNLDGKNDPNYIAEELPKNAVYPQPASNHIFIRMPITIDATALIKLYDQTGHLALAIESSVNNGLIKLNSSALSVGVYQMIISIDGKNYTEKVVVAK